MINNTTYSSPEGIIKRLEELRRWQEEQQKLLIEKQTAQRKILGVEQKQMYEFYGITDTSTPLKSDSSEGNISASNIGTNMSNIDQTFEENSIASHKSPPVGQNPGQIFHNYDRKNNGKTCVMTGAPKPIAESISTWPYLKRGQGILNRFKINPDLFRLQNLPKYKYAGSHKKFFSKSKKLKDDTNLNDPKENKSGNKKTSSILKLEKEIKTTIETLDNVDIDDFSEAISTQRDKKIESATSFETDFENSQPISWAEVLDSKQLKPISVQKLRRKLDDSSILDKTNFLNDSDDLSIFELLEKKVKDGNISLNSSLARQLFTRNNNADEDSFDPRTSELIRISPAPSEIESKLQIDDDSEDSSNEDEEVEDEPNNQKKMHVRFSNNIEISESETTEENSPVQQMTNDTSAFENFKKDIFQNSISINDSQLSNKALIEQVKNEIIEKSDLLKKRLNDLESEIAEFQKHNSDLIKMKQEHELEKVQMQQEKIEIEERLNDERIKFEIYMHDERMKIEEIKLKQDKLFREQRKPNRKEREEVIQLKEQVENLEKENKNKEGKHVAAQSRLRAQIRNLEKDVKELHFEIDHLKKENKRLQNENSKLSRQQNNKLLQEINKNIAKLAPKLEIPATEINNQNRKTVVARVISHKTDITGRDRKKYKSVPNLSRNVVSSSSNSTTSDDDASEEEIEKQNSSFHNKKEKTKEPTKNNLENQDLNLSTNSKNASENCFKREINNPDGSKDIWYPNGNLKKISADGMNIRMLYYNKDIKETNITEGTVKYYYAETNTWHTTYLDGLEILEFPNGQTEHRYKDGTNEVYFPNGSIRISNPNDEYKTEEWKYSDGSTLVQLKNGEKILSLPNGQKEIHTKEHKRREYPDGTVKLLYPDGSQETRYSNGRVRLKDKSGKLVLDSEKL